MKKVQDDLDLAMFVAFAALIMCIGVPVFAMWMEAGQ